MDDHTTVKSAIINYIESVYIGTNVVRLIAGTEPSSWDDRASRLSQSLRHPVFRRTNSFDEDRAISFDVPLSANTQDKLELESKVYTPDFRYTAGQLASMRSIQELDWCNLLVSVLGPFYTMALQKTVPVFKKGWDTIATSPFGSLGAYEAEQDVIRSFFAEHSFRLLDDGLVRSRVENLILPWTAPENVTVLTCLFTGVDFMPD